MVSTKPPQNLDVPATSVPSEASASDLKKLLTAARSNLVAQIQKKKSLDKELVAIESTLYEYESSYLTSATDASSIYGSGPSFGNIVKGYDSYLKAPSASLAAISDRKRGRTANYSNEVRMDERLFSTSSETFSRAVDLSKGIEQPVLLDEPDSDEETMPVRKKRR